MYLSFERTHKGLKPWKSTYGMDNLTNGGKNWPHLKMYAFLEFRVSLIFLCLFFITVQGKLRGLVIVWLSLRKLIFFSLIIKRGIPKNVATQSTNFNLVIKMLWNSWGMKRVLWLFLSGESAERRYINNRNNVFNFLKCDYIIVQTISFVSIK